MQNLQNLLYGSNPLPVSNWWGHFKDGAMEGAEDALSIAMKTCYFAQRTSLEKSAGPWVFKPYNFECPYCGVLLNVKFDGQSFEVVGEKCSQPNGLPVTEFELNVHSGRIVVGNDLRRWYPSNKYFNINSTMGTHLQMLAHSEAGFACGFVGNSCPGVYFDGNRFRIGSFPEGEVRKPLGEQVASVCTDLWWYSIADEADLRRRFTQYTPGEDFEEQAEFFFNIVDVKPGVYRFTHYNEVDWEESTGALYAEFEWVRDPDPDQDMIAKDMALHNTVLECCIQKTLDWPTLYLPLRNPKDYDDNNRVPWSELDDDQKVQAIARVADHFLCTIGGGTDWHPNGFPRMEISAEARQLARGEVIPKIRSEKWYPFAAGYGGLSEGVGMNVNGTFREDHVRFNAEFVQLALNVLQSMILSPETPELSRNVYPPTYLHELSRNRLRLALDFYRAYRRVYPDTVFDRDFDAWVSGDTADDYVASFDFGPRHPPQAKWPKPPKVIAIAELGGFVEFDAAKASDYKICRHPTNPAVKRYALEIKWEGQSLDGFDNWSTNSGMSVPLRFVARVVGWGQGNFSGPVLVVEFDYGTELMVGEGKKQWGINEKDLGAVRHFTDSDDYERCLQEARSYYEEQEGGVK